MKKIYFVLSIAGLIATGCSGSGDNIATEVHNNPLPQPKCETPTSLSFKPLYNIFSWSSNSAQEQAFSKYNMVNRDSLWEPALKLK